MSACCATSRLSITGCLERGLATRRALPLECEGPRIEAAGLWAEFSLRLEDHGLALRFRAAACTTLIAYCQALVELIEDRGPAQAAAMEPAALVAALPGVPAPRRDRAALAVAALRAALASTGMSDHGKHDIDVNKEYAG